MFNNGKCPNKASRCKYCHRCTCCGGRHSKKDCNKGGAWAVSPATPIYPWVPVECPWPFWPWRIQQHSLLGTYHLTSTRYTFERIWEPWSSQDNQGKLWVVLGKLQSEYRSVPGLTGWPSKLSTHWLCISVPLWGVLAICRQKISRCQGQLLNYPGHVFKGINIRWASWFHPSTG